MKIGLVTPAWPGVRTANGIATAVAHLAAGLQSCGHEVTIIPMIVDEPHDFPRVVDLAAQDWTLWEKLGTKLGWGTEAIVQGKVGRQIAAAASEAVERFGIEILIVEESHGWAAEICRRISIPVVVTLHGPWCLQKGIQGYGIDRLDRDREARERAALRQVQAITAPSRDVLDRTMRSWSLPDIPTAVIPNPAPIPPHPTEGPIERMLFVGRFDYCKGGDLVIKAFRHIASKHGTCRLTFVGPDIGVGLPGHPRISLTDALDGLPSDVRARIDVLGQCSRERTASLRQTHGLTIVASRYETFGGTIFEAMGAGSALVCSDACGGAELLSDGQTALVVPSDDPDAIAAACLSALDDPERARRIGLAARAYVEGNLSPEIVGRRMAEFLAAL